MKNYSYVRTDDTSMGTTSEGTVHRADPASGDDIKRRTAEYWSVRARGYKEATRITLERGDDDAIRIIGRFINLNRQLEVADMGTGSGLIAIVLAQQGHSVTAVDNCERMLEVAQESAREAGVEIDFVLGDIEEPPLKKGSFDLVVSRSTVWGLPNPKKAYAAWKELLKPDGEMAIIDGNYYLDLYDDDYRRRMNYLRRMKRDRDSGLHAQTNVDDVDFNIIKDLAYDLPLSRERRPAWDVAALMSVGMTNIHVKSLDKEQYQILTENGITELPSMFVVCAKMPIDESPYMDAVNYPLIDNESLIRIAETASSRYMDVAVVFKALGDINRMKIVAALLSGRMNVQQISYITGSSQSLTSHNLMSLRKAGLVGTERSGREVLYHLTDPYRIKIIVEMCDIIRGKSRSDDSRRPPMPQSGYRYILQS